MRRGPIVRQILQKLESQFPRVRMEWQYIVTAIRLKPHGIAPGEHGRARVSETPDAPQRTEVVIEGSVLLHQDDDVFDILDGARPLIRGYFQRAVDAAGQG
jgi:hypothetical protein